MTILKIFEHKGRALKLIAYEAPAKPARKSSARRAPGTGQFKITQLELTRSGEELTLKAQISGKNIAYLFAEILMKDGDKYYGPVLRETIPAIRDKEKGETKRPDWEESISFSISLHPRLTLLTDGIDSAFAFISPAGYGVSSSRLDGQYTTTKAQTRARMAFDNDGKISEILAFKERGMKSTPHVLTPTAGNTFAPFVHVLIPPTDEDGKWGGSTVLSTPLTFGKQPFQLVTESLIPGEYLVGILIQDLDGGFTRKYVPFTIGS